MINPPHMSMHILPTASLLHGSFQPQHYVDAFAADFQETQHKVGPREVAVAFFRSGPRWVGGLMGVRDAVVRLFGLKTSGRARDPEAALAAFQCVPGERIGIFTVLAVGPQEVVLGEDDRHLDFRVSLWLGDPMTPRSGARSLTISTVVRFHNRWGKLYFMPVKPFHRRIVRVMLWRTVRDLARP